MLDTGPERPGPATSTFICGAATRRWRFGRKDVRLTVLRLGWNPVATTPSLLDRLFSRSEHAARSPLPARPFPTGPSEK